MADGPPARRLAPTLLDRLLDADPRGPEPVRPDAVRELREALRRDLAILLNTRCRPTTPPEALAGSLLDFGVEDFFNTGLATTEQRQRFAARLQSRIARFEPRLEDPRVTLPDAPDPARRSLRLRITARYRARPTLPPLAFETSLDPVTQHFTVTDGPTRAGARHG